MTTVSLASLVEARVDGLMGVAQEYFGTKLRRPMVDYNLRGTSAGMTSLVGMRISLNPVLLYENVDEFVDQTVGHEFTHTMVFQKHGIVRYGHGKQWQTYMRAFKIPIKIDHDYDISTIIGKRRKVNGTTLTFTQDDHNLYQRCCAEYRT